MNLRDIKKDIQYVIGAFIDDCTLFLNMNPGKNADEITGLIDKSVDLCFDSIRKELLEKTDALYDELSAAVKKGLGE